MALITIHFSSQKLATQTIVRVIMPDHPIDHPLKTIWWLHGLGDDGSVWIRKTRLELFASNYEVAIILPDMQRSFAQNIPEGLPFFDYLSLELPQYLQSIFPLSKDRKNNYLVGTSMGGYSAYKWAAICPKKFSYVATLSPVTNLETVTTFMSDYQSIIGKNPNIIPSLNELMSKKVAELKKINWIQYIGTDDSLRSDSENFTSKIKQELGINLNPHVSTGNHNWTFWDDKLPQIFEWLPLSRITTGGMQ